MTTNSDFFKTNPAHLNKLINEVLFAILPMSYLISFAIGLPTILILILLRKLSFWIFIGTGAILGAIAGLLIIYFFPGPPEVRATTENLMILAAFGLISMSVTASVFAVIAGVPQRATYQVPDGS